MGSTIKVDRINAGRAFKEEAHKLDSGELSRFLPGFTDLKIITEFSNLPSEYTNVFYLATRVRDGKLYGVKVVEWSESWSSQNPFQKSYSGTKITLHEVVEKTKTVTYYDLA